MRNCLPETETDDVACLWAIREKPPTSKNQVSINRQVGTFSYPQHDHAYLAGRCFWCGQEAPQRYLAGQEEIRAPGRWGSKKCARRRLSTREGREKSTAAPATHQRGHVQVRAGNFLGQSGWQSWPMEWSHGELGRMTCRGSFISTDMPLGISALGL